MTEKAKKTDGYKVAAPIQEAAMAPHAHYHRSSTPIASRNDMDILLSRPPLGRNHSGVHREHIAAEKIFDAAVYGVWNYGIQTTASVAAAMWFKEFGGKPYFEKSAEWMGKNVMCKISNKTGLAAAEESHSWLTFASLITVGNLFIPPMRYVEKDKEWYVSKINDWLNNRRRKRGETISEEELQHQREEIAAIAAEPRQSSASLWTGRLLGLGANFLAQRFIGTENDKKMQNAFANAVSRSLDGVGAKSLAKSETMKHFSRIALLDYGYSIISSNVVYLYSHFVHPEEKKPHDQQQLSTPTALVASSQIKQPHQPTQEQQMGAAV